MSLETGEEILDLQCDTPDPGLDGGTDGSLPDAGASDAAPGDGGGVSPPLLVPSNVGTALYASEGDVEVNGAETFDTTRCSELPGDAVLVAQVGGPDLCVMRANRITVSEDASLRIVGTRPLVMLAWTDVIIDGTIDASGIGARPGAGGGEAGTLAVPAAGGTHPGQNAEPDGRFDDGGGGGGGLCGTGGAGGAGGISNGGAGGAAQEPSWELIPLVGGSGGALGGQGESAGAGGAGGGGLQISARQELVVRGSILVGGGGGSGGRDASTAADTNIGSGGGGGSGGSILLESPVVTIDSAATLRATGGGGGGSASCRARGDGDAGANGRDHDGRAPGGAQGPSCATTPVQEFGSAGGASGGGADLNAQGGQADAQSGANGGGGGGGAGCVLIRNLNGQAPADVRVSPSAAPGYRVLRTFME